MDLRGLHFLRYHFQLHQRPTTGAAVGGEGLTLSFSEIKAGNTALVQSPSLSSPPILPAGGPLVQCLLRQGISPYGESTSHVFTFSPFEGVSPSLLQLTHVCT